MITRAKAVDKFGDVLCETVIEDGMLRGAVVQAVGRLTYEMTPAIDDGWEKVIIEVNRWEQS